MSRSTVAAALCALAALAGCPKDNRVKTATPLEVHTGAGADPTGPHAAAIAAQVTPYLDAEIVGGVVVGIIDGDRTEIYGFGARVDGQPGRPDGGTIFEVGSFSQTFTSLLLADAVARGEVTYDTPLAKLLPLGVTVPTAGGEVITVEELATHRSGLPALPKSLALQQFAADPYAGYDADRLYQDLTVGRLEAVPGHDLRYSAWGVGVLGFVLGRKAGDTYGAIVGDRVAKPLGLVDTRLDLPHELDARVAAGHNEDLAPVSPWHPGIMAGTAGLHSTARDLLVLVRAQLDAMAGGKGPLADRLRALAELRVPAEPRGVALGWWVEKDGRRWHNGASGGSHVFVGFDPGKKQGVVVLASASTSLVDRLGGALLDTLGAATPPPPPVFPTPEELRPLTGAYTIGDAQATIELRGKRLYLAQQGATPTRLEPLGGAQFFVEEVQAPLAFEVEDGKVVGLVLLVGGQKLEGLRTGDLPPPPPAPTPSPAPAPGPAPAPSPAPAPKK